MKYLITGMLGAVLITGVCWAGDNLEMKDEMQKVNYSVGYQLGGDFKRQGLALDPEALVKGIETALAGGEPLMTEQEMRTTLVALKKSITASEKKKKKEAAEKNLAAGEAFLAENGGKEGVVTLPSGLQYRVLEQGEGTSPKPVDTVTVHYVGTRIDGTEFDSSYSRNQPATFRADRVIAGWKEALPLMKEGAKWKLFIPSALAYGERGAGSKIGPNDTLVFEVELLSVQPGS